MNVVVPEAEYSGLSEVTGRTHVKFDTYRHSSLVANVRRQMAIGRLLTGT